MIGALRRSMRGADRDLQLREPDAADGARARSRAQAADAGVDGVLALDLPIEEAGDFRDDARRRVGIDTIFLLSPTTTDERMRKAAELGSGFLYGISRLGVTGARDQVADGRRGDGARGFARTRRCRSRSASAFRSRSTCRSRPLGRRGGRRQRAGVA